MLVLFMLFILSAVLECKCLEKFTVFMHVLFMLFIPIAVLECECLEKFYYFYACALHALHTNCVNLEHNCLDNLTISVYVPFALFILVVILEKK